MLICVKFPHHHVTISAQLVTVISPPCYTPITYPPQKTIMHNLAELSKEDKDKVNVDLSASGVAYKERLGKPVIDVEVERQQPEHLREYFRERLVYYRKLSKRFPQGYEYNKES